MKPCTFVIMVILVAICLSFSSAVAEEELPPPEAGAFWTYITETNPYTEWDFWPGYEGIYPGKSPHGAYLKLYANDIAIEAAKTGKDMPYGAILVKENYGKDKKTLMALTPMYKVEGYDPDNGDWFWVKYGPDGEAAKAGKVEGCINCHRAAEDYRFVEPK